MQNCAFVPNAQTPLKVKIRLYFQTAIVCVSIIDRVLDLIAFLHAANDKRNNLSMQFVYIYIGSFFGERFF